MVCGEQSVTTHGVHGALLWLADNLELVQPLNDNYYYVPTKVPPMYLWLYRISYIIN